MLNLHNTKNSLFIHFFISNLLLLSCFAFLSRKIEKNLIVADFLTLNFFKNYCMKILLNCDSKNMKTIFSLRLNVIVCSNLFDVLYFLQIFKLALCILFKNKFRFCFQEFF